VCIVLERRSRTDNGLRNANESSAFTFGWRFFPTIVAVLYTLLWGPIAKDVIRTEPYALMARPGGSRAEYSLLRGDDFWITEVWHAFWKAKRRLGGVRWALLIALFASMAGSVLLNPLSAGFLDVTDITFNTKEQFLTIKEPETPAPFPNVGATTLFGTISNLFYHTTTSAWILPNYVVKPFWPSDVPDVPLTASLSTVPQVWNGTSDIFQIQYGCSLLHVLSVTTTNKDTRDPLSLRFVLQSDDGCSATVVRSPEELNKQDFGGFWSKFDVRYSVRFILRVQLTA
jgi:hypothetical protein